MSWPTGGAIALHCDSVKSIIHYIHLFELCWNILPHWLWFSSYIRICSYVRICSDFSIEDWKIIYTVCQTVTQCCCCASVQFVMQPLASKQIHNTNSPVTRVVVSVFEASQNGKCFKKKPFFVFEQRKSWCLQTPSRAHSLFKRQLWLTLTKDIFLMICLDVQLELTLQSDMDHWVYRALSELTSEYLSPLHRFLLLSVANQIKKSFIGMNGRRKNVVKHLSL